MKALAINGSARKDGNTAILLNTVLDTLKKGNVDTEIFQLAGEKIHGCRACGKCREKKNKQCIFKDDILNDILSKMIEADVILLGSPVYFATISPEIKCVIDRAGYVARGNGDLFKHKIGASVVCARRAGCVSSFDVLNHMFFISQMIVPGSTYWNLGLGKDIGDVKNDTEALDNMKNLGENILFLLEKIKA